MNVASLPSLEELIPHSGISLLLDRLLDYDGTTTTCLVDVGKQRWMKNTDGSVPSWLTLEYMAQCMAVHESIQAWLEGRRPDLGLLAAVADIQVHAPVLEPGRKFRVRATRLRGSPELKAFTHACDVFGEDDEPIAEGRITVALEIPALEAIR